MPSKIDTTPLKRWFLETRRDLPWRNNPSPYQVWVSEVMLQQTQVKVVIPYFERWMERFPTIKSLAEADLDQVIKLWEGLGYYSRARNLHEGARQVIDRFGGILPESSEELAKIKGLGPYTIGAILSFAYHQKAPAVDGNVLRVISRLFQITDDFSKAAPVKKVWELAGSLLPEKESWIINEALIELGATLCTRTPKCRECPLKASCQSFTFGDPTKIPYKSKKTPIEYLYRAVPVITCEEHILLRRGDKGILMSDLHEFPYFPCEPTPPQPKDLQKQLPFKTSYIQSLATVSHSFTRYQATLFPFHFEAAACSSFPNHQWYPLTSMQSLAFSSGHKRILHELLKGT